MFDINVHRHHHGLCTLYTGKISNHAIQERYVIQFAAAENAVGWQSSNLLPCNTLENHPSVIQIVKKHFFLLDFSQTNS